MALLSSTASEALRAALIAAGYTAEGITPQGDLDPFLLLSNFYDTIEIRTRVTPPLKLPMSALGGEPGPIGGFLQGSVILTGPGGRTELAPRGLPSPLTGWLFSLGLLGILVGSGYALGLQKCRRSHGQRRR